MPMELPVKISNSGHLQNLYKIKTKNLSYKVSARSSYAEFNWLGWNDATSSKTKWILKNVDCEARPREITAIVGPSGAGKTTLLEILSGAIVPSKASGHVLVNDLPMDAVSFRRVSGYVTQDDALFPCLTVEETLIYSACLRMQGTREKARSRAQKLLKELGLDHIARQRIGSESSRGISGGEKRRVSIGVDLVHDPSVLLLDEPTTGLDSASALQITLLLKSLAKNQGKTILLTIHQPGYRILDLFDRVMLLSGGILLHNDSLNLLEERLKTLGHCIPQHVNVLEFAIDVIETLHKEESDTKQREVEQEYDHIMANSILDHLEEESMLYCNSLFREVIILSKRFSSNIFRTKQLFAAKASQTLLAGIVLGTVFMNVYNHPKGSKIQNQIGFFAFSLTFLMSSTTEALPIFLQERRILMRETSRGAYRISSYIIANTLVFFPFLLIVALLYSIPVYWLVGLRREFSAFLYFSVVVWMVVLVSNSFVACFGALVPNFITGMSLVAGVMGSFFLFSGYFISKDSIPKFWSFMLYLSLFKYPYECFIINEFGGEQGKTRCLESFGGECLLHGDQFLMQQGLKAPQKWNNLVIISIFIVGYRFVGCLILWYRSYRSRR